MWIFREWGVALFETAIIVGKAEQPWYGSPYFRIGHDSHFVSLIFRLTAPRMSLKAAREANVSL